MKPVLKGKHPGAQLLALSALEAPDQFPGKVLSVHIFESTAMVVTLLEGEIQALRYVHNGVPAESEAGIDFSLRPPRPDDDYDEADYQDPLAEAYVEEARQIFAEVKESGK